MQSTRINIIGPLKRFASTINSIKGQSYGKITGDGQKVRPPPNKTSMKMRGWQLHSYGDIDELQFSDKLKVPPIRSSCDCMVRVSTTTVNPIDLAMLKGYGATVLNTMRCQPSNGIEFPLTLGREFAGELVQKGMGVSDKSLQLGTRVWGVVPVQLPGAHSEFVTVPSYCLAAAPQELDDFEAASLLYAGLTAWSGLYVTGRLGGLCGATSSSGGGNAHNRVLVLGGSGSVGSIAIQILKSQNVQVLATCNEDAVEMVKALGTDHVIDYNNPVAMKDLNTYGPYDIVLDCAGLGGQHASQLPYDFRQFITFNSPLLSNIDKQGLGLGMLQNMVDLVESNVKALTQKGGLVKYGFFTPAPHAIKFLQRLVKERKLLPLVDSTYDFDNLPKAFERMQSGHLRGKIVVKL